LRILSEAAPEGKFLKVYTGREASQHSARDHKKSSVKERAMCAGWKSSPKHGESESLLKVSAAQDSSSGCSTWHNNASNGVPPMIDRILLWTFLMALVGFLIAGKGSYLPLSVTISGAVMGAGIGLLLAIVFSNREKRKREPTSSLTR
jgi:hypothetical protein